MFDTSDGRVANGRRMEVAPDLLRSVLGAPEEAADVADQLPLGPWALTPHGVGLDVLVEEFVRVELGAVAGQEVEPDPSRPAPHPACHGLGDMHGVPIHDHEDLPVSLAHEPVQEADEHPRGEAAPEDHKRQLAPVGDRRKHVATEPLAGARDHRRATAAPIGAARLMVRAHPRLVAPVDLGPFSTSQRPDGGVLSPQPAPHRGRVLLVGPALGLLRREAPAGQVAAHRPDREAHAALPSDEVSHGLARPEDKGQLELVGTAIRNQADHRSRLVGLQIEDPRPAPGTHPQCAQSTGAPTPVPPIDRLPGDPKRPGRRRLRHASADGLDDAQPKVCLRLWRQVARVGPVHAVEYATTSRLCQTFMLRLVSIRCLPFAHLLSHLTWEIKEACQMCQPRSARRYLLGRPPIFPRDQAESLL